MSWMKDSHWSWDWGIADWLSIIDQLHQRSTWVNILIFAWLSLAAHEKYFKFTEQPSSIWDTGFSSWRLLSATTRLDEVATVVLSLLLLDSGKQKEGKIVSNKTVFRRRSECIREKVISRFLLKSRQRVGSQLRAIRGQNTQLNLNVPSPTSVTLALHLWLFWYYEKIFACIELLIVASINSFQNHTRRLRVSNFIQIYFE